jgi:hypothetical protein
VAISLACMSITVLMVFLSTPSELAAWFIKMEETAEIWNPGGGNYPLPCQ